jgi:hypothetical protein
MQLPLMQPASPQDTRWKSILDPLLAGPLAGALLLPNVPVVTGTNVINHGLGQPLRGYIVVQNSANVTFFDNQRTNATPQLTLLLQASGASTISLLVF